jgi:hypothetical protein
MAQVEFHANQTLILVLCKVVLINMLVRLVHMERHLDFNFRISALIFVGLP